MKVIKNQEKKGKKKKNPYAEGSLYADGYPRARPNPKSVKWSGRSGPTRPDHTASTPPPSTPPPSRAIAAAAPSPGGLPLPHHPSRPPSPFFPSSGPGLPRPRRLPLPPYPSRPEPRAPLLPELRPHARCCMPGCLVPAIEPAPRRLRDRAAARPRSGGRR